MKKLILLCFAAVISFGSIKAQPLNIGDMPKIGYTADRFEVDSVGLQWMKDMMLKDTIDLRGIPAGEDAGLVTIIDPLKVADTARFPVFRGSNYGFKSELKFVQVTPIGTITTIFTQMLGAMLNTNGLYFKGGYFSSVPDTIIPPFVQPDTADFRIAKGGLFYKFPLAKGNSFKDTSLTIQGDTTGGHLDSNFRDMDEELTMTVKEVLSEVTLILPDSAIFGKGLLIKAIDLSYDTEWEVNKDTIMVQRDTTFDTSYSVVVKDQGGMLDFSFDTDRASLSYTKPAGPQSVDKTGQSTQIDEFSVSRNYPNPFNPQTYFSFYLPRSEKVSVRILNIRGQLVGEVINGVLPAGKSDVKLNMQKFSSGVYFYEVKTPTHRVVRRMVLLK